MVEIPLYGMEFIQLINLRRHVEFTSRKRYKPPQETLSVISIPVGESQPLFLYGGFQKFNMVMVKDDFHPAETTFVVLGDFETDVLLFIHWEKVAVIFIDNHIIIGDIPDGFIPAWIFVWSIF